MKLYTIPEAAQYLRVSESLVKKLSASREIAVYKLGARVVIAETDLDAWLATKREAKKVAPRTWEEYEAMRRQKA